MGLISASLMCADLMHMEADVRELEQAGIDYFHFDIMDGHFVPNITLGPDLLCAVRKVTMLPFDIHLMVEKPEEMLHMFDIRAGDIVTVHQESTYHLQRMLQQIKEMGAVPGVALNPATSIQGLENVLDDIGIVLLMTVNPGYAGQKMIPSMIRKISSLKNYLRSSDYDNIMIEVDGNVNLENAYKMREAGVEVFVAGSSGIFIKDAKLLDTVAGLKQIIG